MSQIDISFIIVIILIYIDIIIVMKFLLQRVKNENSEIKFKLQNAKIIKFLANKNKEMIKDIEIDDRNFTSFSQVVDLEYNEKERLKLQLKIDKFENQNIKNLFKSNEIVRIKAAVNLGNIKTKKAKEELEKALINEKSNIVKLYIANSLSDINNEESIPVLVESLVNSHRWYREKVNMMIVDYSEKFAEYLPQIIRRNESEIKELILDFSKVYFSEELKNYLIELADYSENVENIEIYNYLDKNEKCCGNCLNGRYSISKRTRKCQFEGEVDVFYSCKKFKRLPVSIEGRKQRKKIIYDSCDILKSFYPEVLDNLKYLEHKDKKIRRIAIKSLTYKNSNIKKVIEFLKDEEVCETATKAIMEILEKQPEYINVLIQFFTQDLDEKTRIQLAMILNNKIEYIIMKLNSKYREQSKMVLQEIILSSKTSEVINFLNNNKDIYFEDSLLEIIKDCIIKNESIKTNFAMTLNERLLVKCGLIRHLKTSTKNIEQRDIRTISMLYGILILILCIFPAIYFVRHINIFFTSSITDQIRIYILDFNYYISYYSISINLIYLVLLILSFKNLKNQASLWSLKSMKFLFKKKILPEISIIAPAYNEEETVIQSTNSLLNLTYPDYELIIVNDGSTDKTLKALIENFDLKKVDLIVESKIKTRNIIGVYKNPSIPKLIVVDKENGGKADSLNAGINVSKKEYFCGIDADSLLEDKALLKLSSMTLDSSVETPALGGNIYPANGCTISHGALEKIGIPQNIWARFQTIEYLRAFMAGRLGWSYINSLLIISGAFGLFRKERVISVGGYLTSSGLYEKDTVGEDMELIVRISRFMRENKLKYEIKCSYDANCWTEVPEDLNSLKKQRFRWHRGLIDILTFHKKMIFNPFYGRTGLISMGYYFIFEMIGPLVECQGYLMIFLAIIFGFLNFEIAMLLFISTILIGVLVSLSSLLIAEKYSKYFEIKDIKILILYSILENFGPRQIFSFFRVVGFIQMLQKPKGWEKSQRRGFNVDGKEK